MSKDTIYRQAAVEALEAKKDKSAKGDMGCFYNTIIQNDIDALKGLPPAQPELIEKAAYIRGFEQGRTQGMIDKKARPRWIPMKERRPEKDGRYLCTFQGKAVHICMYLNGCFRLYGYNKDNLITAWMPMPEPYRKEEHDATD